MTSQIKTVPFLVLTTMMALFLSGCGRTGPQRVAVRGTVIFDSQPLENGRITFVPMAETKGPAAVAVVQNGFFVFEKKTGPVMGKNRVEIESMLDPGFALDDEAAYAKAATKYRGKPVLPRDPIPETYNRKSELVIVATGENMPLDFVLNKPSIGRR
ncbi:MAG: hypothetical protein Q8K78_05385 [Planctomycetaceae bacterium]|nr:hypothetical protein [Planctomycetaceae bacterium]